MPTIEKVVHSTPRFVTSSQSFARSDAYEPSRARHAPRRPRFCIDTRLSAADMKKRLPLHVAQFLGLASTPVTLRELFCARAKQIFGDAMYRAMPIQHMRKKMCEA